MSITYFISHSSNQSMTIITFTLTIAFSSFNSSMDIDVADHLSTLKEDNHHDYWSPTNHIMVTSWRIKLSMLLVV